jgi:biotin carboxyl carrier protein
MNIAADTEARLFLDGHAIAAPLSTTGQGQGLLTPEGGVVVFEAGEAFTLFLDPPARTLDGEAGGGHVHAPMPGKVTAVRVAVGDTVAKGAALVTLEAMKMEHTLIAAFDGVVGEVAVVEGAQVSEGALLVVVEASEA